MPKKNLKKRVKSQKSLEEKAKKRRLESTCHICEKTFSKKSNLNTHIRTVHEEIKVFECARCGRRFPALGDMERHVSSVHDKIKPFKCPTCESRFARKDEMQNHCITVHEKIKRFRCEICDKRYSASGDLNRHVKKNTKVAILYVVISFRMKL